MTRTAQRFRRQILIVAIAALALASFPMTGAYALGPSDPPTPAAPGKFGEVRLELAWARQRFMHDRMAVLFDHADQRLGQAQTLLDRAKANGKDVTGVQAALDGLTAAVKQARPIFESMNGIIASHQGFDANGKVTDVTLAMETVQAMAGKIRDVRNTVIEPAKTLRTAIQAFRQENRPTSSPSPTPGG
jgi:hypothetical protein